MANRLPIKNLEQEHELTPAKARQLAEIIDFLWNIED